MCHALVLIIILKFQPCLLSIRIIRSFFRPPSSAAVVLHHNGVGPITSISWDPEGGLLAVASPSDNFITVCDKLLSTCF